MAEDEIRKHAKATYNVLRDKEKTWKHKLTDILVEILIIVFAVTISIWFHNWSEEVKDHKEERNFLTELEEDLKADSSDIKGSLQFYESTLMGIKFFEKVGTGDSLRVDSLHKYGDLFFSSTRLQAHTSRYEGLKGSGKFNIIQDNHLLNDIIDLHEHTLTHIELLNNFYVQYVQELGSFISDHAQLDQQGHIGNLTELLHSSKIRILLTYGNGLIENNIIPANEKGIQKTNSLNAEIDKFLHD